jgi:hypothetical protein
MHELSLFFKLSATFKLQAKIAFLETLSDEQAWFPTFVGIARSDASLEITLWILDAFEKVIELLFHTENNPSLCHIVGRKLKPYTIPGQNPDVINSHFTS